MPPLPAAEQNTFVNPTVAKIMQPFGDNSYTNRAQAINNQVTQGSLILFPYKFFKTDPYPLVIVTDFKYGERLKGINIHYLTFAYIRDNLLTKMNLQNISYKQISGDAYIINAFRHYKWQGIDWPRIKKLDINFITKVANLIRAKDPSEVNQIRQMVREEMQRQVNPTANELSGSPVEQPANNNALQNPPSTPQQAVAL